MPPEPVQVAFRVYPDDWGLRGHGSRQIDWLVDGTVLHQGNVLFVIDQPISRAYKQALQVKYRVYDASLPFKLNSFSSANRHRWHKFLVRWAPKHWVSYNDFHPRHKERNQIFRAAGVQSWYYSHSVNLPPEGYAPWKQLDYDHLVFNNETDAAQFEGGTKHILGPLFSSQVPQTVVAVFDSTPENYPPGTHGKFLDEMYALLSRHPGMVMLYKPKWKPRLLLTIKNFYVLPEWIEPGLVIGCSHFSISLYGTSTKVEAEGAGKPAFDYNPWTQTIDDLLAPPISQMSAFIRAPQTDTPADRFRELLTT
jgi:hypothetical protein